MDFLSALKRKFSEPMGDVSEFVGNLQNPQHEIDVARGVAEGSSSPELSGMNPESLGMMDRMAWGQDMNEHFGPGLAIPSAAVMGGGYEAVKAGAQSNIPGLSHLSNGILGLAGQALPLGGEMEINERTSPANIMNPLAMLHGAAFGRSKPKFGQR